jgi:pimeloyl-ACP methyl ester carboxylesterase
MPMVISSDGTKIAYETMGAGPPLILVDGAMCYRDFGPMRPLAEALQDRFTVIIYDRRGRGESGDTTPYAKEREIEDLLALIDGPGEGSVYLYGCSSGAALALEAANAAPDKVRKLIMYEMPVIIDASRKPITPEYRRAMEARIAAGENGKAAKLFMKSVGVPGFFLMIMPLMMGKAWKKLEAVAPTLPHDFAFVGDYQQGNALPAGRWQDVRAKVLVGDGGKSPAWMRNGQAAIARNLRAAYQTLPGQTHMVKPGPQAPMIKDFLGAA